MNAESIADDEEICFCEECWIVGDEDAFAKVQSMCLPTQIDLSEKSFANLGTRFAEQAEELLDDLYVEFEEDLAAVISLAIRQSYYAEFRTTKSIDTSYASDRYSCHIEDNVSIRFRSIADPVEPMKLNLGLAVYLMSEASNLQAADKSEDSFNLLFQAQFLLRLYSIREYTNQTINAITNEKKERLTAAGQKGLESLHAKTNELKAWAESELAKVNGIAKTKPKARKLAQRIPAHLRNSFEDPEAIIYRHLLSLEKQSPANAAS